MRHLTKLIAIIFLTSCFDKPQKETIKTLPENLWFATTTLRDSLGTVSFAVPANFDTSFTWTNYSDCGKPCNQEQYRYQPRTLPIFKESGFCYVIPDIPINQFTIIHSGYFLFHDGIGTTRIFGRHKSFVSRLLSDSYNGTIDWDTIEKINDRYFSVVYIHGFDKIKRQHFAKLAAVTTIKSNEIELKYDIRTKDTINLKSFYQSSIQFLRTVRMSNGI